MVSLNSDILDIAGVKWFQQQKIKSRQKRDFQSLKSLKKDPLYEEMWYLNPEYYDEMRGRYRNSPGEDIRHMNITGAWAAGYTGKGVTVTILDDGLETTHPDLIDNFDAAASFDVNNEDPDPNPRYSVFNKHFDWRSAKIKPGSNRYDRLTENVVDFKSEENMHGTRCAGQAIIKTSYS